MRKCPICNNKKLKIVLDKNKTNIFTGTSNYKKYHPQFKCLVYQCLGCNFIFQNPSKHLKNKLSKIYSSNEAQLSQPLGEGNWGKERFNSMKEKLSELENFKKKSILEIACGNGHILKYLKLKKYKDLNGIDPSLNKNYKSPNLTLYNKFVSKNLKLNKKFDLIFSICFYEHAYNINEITAFSSKHLSENGTILVIVPNVESSLKYGNPDLFAHEHISYFTTSTIKKHFANFNFYVSKNFTDKYAIAIYFKKRKKEISQNNKKINTINYKYENILNNKLKNLYKITLNNKIIIHGACNSLNNILSWINYKINYELVDNDENKINKLFFDKKVRDLRNLKLNNYDLVFIVPLSFSPSIIENYKQLGFKGKYLTINSI